VTHGLPLRHRQLPKRQGKASFKCDLQRHTWVVFVCGRHLPLWRTVFWCVLGPQVLWKPACACIELFCSLNERTFRKVVSEGSCTPSSRERRCALSRITLLQDMCASAGFDRRDPWVGQNLSEWYPAPHVHVVSGCADSSERHIIKLQNVCVARRYDAIVVGVGGMGSAALYHLAKRGSKVRLCCRLRERISISAYGS